MKNKLLSCAIFAVVSSFTAYNSVADNKPATSQASHSSAAESIALYTGQAKHGVRVIIESPAAQQELTGNKADVAKVAGSSAPKAEVSVFKSKKNAEGDALTFSWKDSWRASLKFELATPVNLTDYIDSGIVEFEMNVIDLAKGGLAFKSKCGPTCDRQIPFLLSAREVAGGGWRRYGVPLACFAHDDDNFSSVNLPFALETGGAGLIEIANVNIKKAGRANVDCLDYKTVSVVPAMLTEWWSIDWWLPRHLQKLEEIKTKKNAQLVFIGDSITQGWENDGFNVWNRNYKKYDAVALGFGGDRTENVLWRLQHGEVDGLNPKVAVLMFGTNNTGHRQEDPHLTAAGIKRNIDELQKRLPNTKILLLAIFPRDEKPDGQLRQINERINSIIATYADNKNVFFLNINKSFLDENGVLSKTIMPDLLHPNEKGYEIWAKAMEPSLVKLLKK